MNGISLIVTLEFLSSSPEYKKILSVMQAGDPTTSTAPSGSGKAPHCCSLERETRADAGMEVEAGGGRERGYGNSGSAKAQEGIGAWGFLAASLRWCPWAWADGGFRSSSKR